MGKSSCIVAFYAVLPCSPRNFLDLHRQRHFKYSYHLNCRQEKDIVVPETWTLSRPLIIGRQPKESQSTETSTPDSTKPVTARCYERTSSFCTPVVAPDSNWPQFLVDQLPNPTVGITELEQLWTTPEAFDVKNPTPHILDISELTKEKKNPKGFSLFGALKSTQPQLSIPERYDIYSTYRPSFWQDWFNTEVYWELGSWSHTKQIPQGVVDFRGENPSIDSECCIVKCTIVSDFKMPIIGHFFNDPICSQAKDSAQSYCKAVSEWFLDNFKVVSDFDIDGDSMLNQSSTKSRPISSIGNPLLIQRLNSSRLFTDSPLIRSTAVTKSPTPFKTPARLSTALTETPTGFPPLLPSLLNTYQQESFNNSQPSGNIIANLFEIEKSIQQTSSPLSLDIQATHNLENALSLENIDEPANSTLCSQFLFSHQLLVESIQILDSITESFARMNKAFS